ncbi:MAG: hypothetical protein R6V56_01255, partial [Lentisphaeria bacterium]
VSSGPVQLPLRSAQPGPKHLSIAAATSRRLCKVWVIEVHRELGPGLLESTYLQYCCFVQKRVTYYGLQPVGLGFHCDGLESPSYVLRAFQPVDALLYGLGSPYYITPKALKT